jgi:hypothetical protein
MPKLKLTTLRKTSALRVYATFQKEKIFFTLRA